MPNAVVVAPEPQALQLPDSTLIPTLFTNAGEQASYRFVEFFTATIPNLNTRKAYYRAVLRLSDWCELRGLELTAINPVIMAKYIQELGEAVSIPTVKQHLAAIRMLFDYLVTGHIILTNPATPVKTPKHVVRQGKTPILSAEETRDLLDSIPVDTIGGLRDRAILGVMTFSFARVGAVAGMDVGDYFQKGRRKWLRLHEKGGKYHEMPAHHNIEDYVSDYLDEAGITNEKKKPLFRTLNRKRQLSETRINRIDVFQMIRRRARQAGLPENICCHTFRGTGITVYLQNGGSLEVAQQMAAHSSPETTKLYDRTSDEISLDEVERIII